MFQVALTGRSQQVFRFLPPLGIGIGLCHWRSQCNQETPCSKVYNYFSSKTGCAALYMYTVLKPRKWGRISFKTLCTGLVGKGVPGEHTVGSKLADTTMKRNNGKLTTKLLLVLQVLTFPAKPFFPCLL